MTSWKLTPKAKDQIVGEAQRLLNLRTAVMEADFPLTREQVVEATIPMAARQVFEVLAALRSDILRTTHEVYAIVPVGNGVDRAALIGITLATPTCYVWDAQAYSNHYWRTTFTNQDEAHLPFDMTAFPTETQSRLITWLNRAIRERRIADAAHKLVIRFISEYCECTGELNQRWPELRVVFSKLPDPWPARMRDVSMRATTRWAWPPSGLAREWSEENFRKMEGVASVLAGASLMDYPAEPQDKPLVRARIVLVAPRVT